RYWQEAQSALCGELGHQRCRLAGNHDGRRDLAGLELCNCIGLRQVDFLDLDIQPAEHVARGELCLAADGAEIHGLACELLDRPDPGIVAHYNMHLLTKQPGDVDDAALKTPDVVAATKRIQKIGLGDAQVDALEEPDIADVLPAALAEEG